jgi:hypothetical protein
MRLRSAALAYAANAWAVFPCKPGEKVPATKHGCLDATTDPDRVAAWWDRMPDANIGVAAGKASGIFVLDVDGDEGLDALLDLGHGIPSTLTQHTPSGGLHFVFAYPAEVGNSARTLGPNLDTRGDGGYIVAAPSIHPNGGRYRWAGKSRPATVPGWLIRLIRPVPAKPKPLPKVDESERLGRYVAAAVEGECSELAAMPPGGRNNRLHVAAVKLGTLVATGALDTETAHGRLLAAAAACGLVRDDGERQCRKTIHSGLSYGIAHPREVAS